MTRWLAFVALAVASCGRSGLPVVGETSDAAGDAPEEPAGCSVRDDCPPDEPCILWRCKADDGAPGACIGIPTGTPDCPQ